MEKEKSNLNFEMLEIPKEYLTEGLIDSSLQFSFLSYNLLAPSLSARFATYVSDECWQFKNRFKKQKDQILELNPDILFFQEVDNPEEWMEFLETLGYKAVSNKKNNPNIDWIMIGYKKEMFEMIKDYQFNLFENHSFVSNPSFENCHVALGLKLKHIKTEKNINFLNAHLMHLPTLDFVKYMQMSIIVKFIQENFSNDEAIVWGGDYNTFGEGNLINYILMKKPPQYDQMETPNKENFEYFKIIYSELKEAIKTDFKWESCYKLYGKCTGNKSNDYPKYTNYTPDFKETIDHIFYNPSKVFPLKLLKIPEDLTNYSLPSEIHPSDHLPLKILFQIQE